MFLVNSRLGLVCATLSRSAEVPRHPTRVPLLPKLRGHFAEFLNEGSLTRLRSTSVSTCVGFGYGHPLLSLEGFSWCAEGNHFRPDGPVSLLGVAECGICHTSPLRGSTWYYHSQAGLSPHVPPIAQTSSQWYRIIPRFAITYA